MAFDANRSIKIEASETSPGFYLLRSRGLADKRRAELEITGVPEAALSAAGGIINILAQYSVDKAEVLAGQNVGNVLAIGDEARELLLVVRTVEAEKAKGGLWSKIAGAGKGVLRLVDVDGPDTAAPRTALATMLVHRAAVRRAKGDDEGARTELEAAVLTFPGEPGAGSPPSIDGVDGVLDWQNHLAYLDLAALAGDDADAAAAHFGEALVRSDELARRELGATAAAVQALGEAEIEREAKRVLAHNLGDIRRGPGPTDALVTVASPLWRLGDDGASVRHAALVPAAMLGLYYEGAAAEALARDGVTLVTRILAAPGSPRWRAAWLARGSREIWLDESAPVLERIEPAPAHPAAGIVSLVLADVGRCLRAGATIEEILARYDNASAIDDKLAALRAWESEQYAAAMSAG